MKFLGHTASKREVQERERLPIPNPVLQTYVTLLMILKPSTPYLLYSGFSLFLS